MNVRRKWEIVVLVGSIRKTLPTLPPLFEGRRGATPLCPCAPVSLRISMRYCAGGLKVSLYALKYPFVLWNCVLFSYSSLNTDGSIYLGFHFPCTAIEILICIVEWFAWKQMPGS